MILKGSQRAGAAALADHLLNDRDNDHVTLLEVSGFVADDLPGALQEAHAISKATKCTQYLFSLSLNPPEDHCATEQELVDAVDRAEEKLGLTGQPRAIIIHEKEGRRHAHAVWSRIDPDEMKAINLPHFKRRLTNLSRDLYLENDWELPKGLQRHGGRNPLNFTLAEWQQAKRQGQDPREIKQILRSAWERSDTKRAFEHALEEHGFVLAKGDRRGFVVLDHEGHVYSLSRWIGTKAKDIKAKLGDAKDLASVDAQRLQIKARVTGQMKGYIAQVRDQHIQEMAPFQRAKAAMVAQHREERDRQKEGQAAREKKEQRLRQDRFASGLKALWDRLSGKSKSIRDENTKDAMEALKRDQRERDYLVFAQMQDRRVLQREFRALRGKHAHDRNVLARQIGQALQHLRQPETVPSPPKGQERKRGSVSKTRSAFDGKNSLHRSPPVDQRHDQGKNLPEPLNLGDQISRRKSKRYKLRKIHILSRGSEMTLSVRKPVRIKINAS